MIDLSVISTFNPTMSDESNCKEKITELLTIQFKSASLGLQGVVVFAVEQIFAGPPGQKKCHKIFLKTGCILTLTALITFFQYLKIILEKMTFPQILNRFESFKRLRIPKKIEIFRSSKRFLRKKTS